MTTQIQINRSNDAKQDTIRGLKMAAPLAMAAGTAANLALYAAAGALFPAVTAWPGASAGQIVGANVVYLLMGTIVFALVRRFSGRPARHYTHLATIGLLLSLVLPISAGFGYGAPGVPAAGVATVVTLSLMHVVTYAISVPLYIRRALV